MFHFIIQFLWIASLFNSLDYLIIQFFVLPHYSILWIISFFNSLDYLIFQFFRLHASLFNNFLDCIIVQFFGKDYLIIRFVDFFIIIIIHSFLHFFQFFRSSHFLYLWAFPRRLRTLYDKLKKMEVHLLCDYMAVQ